MLLTTAASLSSSLLILFNNPAVSPFPPFSFSFISFLSHPYTDLQTCRHTHRRTLTVCLILLGFNCLVSPPSQGLSLYLHLSFSLRLSFYPDSLSASHSVFLGHSVTRVSSLLFVTLMLSFSLSGVQTLSFLAFAGIFLSLTSAPWHGGHCPLPHCSVRHL